LAAQDLASALRSLLGDAPARQRMALAAGGLIDGQGADRVVARLRAATLRLRPAEEADCRLLWEWANDPVVRGMSFSSEPIPWEDHRRWLAGRLASPSCRLFVALTDAATPVGQIRFDTADGETAEVAVSVARDHRGGGLGAALILAGVTEVFRRTPLRALHAYVKEENTPSLRAFALAGFDPVGKKLVRGHQAVHLVRGRDHDP
jgi:RimJ/RimL family protein N-acetyltransferase